MQYLADPAHCLYIPVFVAVTNFKFANRFCNSKTRLLMGMTQRMSAQQHHDKATPPQCPPLKQKLSSRLLPAIGVRSASTLARSRR